jgi:two-component system NarL family response regulator
MTYTVLVADDHALFRQGVVATLAAVEDFTVVGEAATGAEAVTQASALQPGVVLLDVDMPEGDGVSVLPTLRDAVPEAKLVMLTVAEDHDTVVRSLELGAAGYLVKGIEASAFVAALRAIMEGEPYVSPSVAGRILASLKHATHPDGSPPPVTLTDRERDVLALLARGQTNREIADSLSLSEKTIKRHVTGILSKLDVRNRTEAAIRAASFETDTSSP